MSSFWATPFLQQFDGAHNRQSWHKKILLQLSLFLWLLSRRNSLGVCLDYITPSNGHSCCDVRERLRKHHE
ncbi:hypothetical protein N7463_008285 [Penicillium fimorum]|uniref:Uncharacterized protein n=1 Tax=Penicillium fimorum TaxID=1882269 RepID=A0A9X0C339_9EURO|nr:hypothetical protein N7463_008285 [Penicillium fimorum]